MGIRYLFPPCSVGWVLLSLLTVSCGRPAEESQREGFVLVFQHRGPVLGYSPESGVGLLKKGGRVFKDLDRNGRLDLYEDWRRTPRERAEDLVHRLDRDALCGLLVNGNAINVPGHASMSVSGLTYGGKAFPESGADSSALCDQLLSSVVEDHLRQVLLAHAAGPRIIARWNNRLQALCEREPFGIPSNNSSDPRNEVRATDEFNAGSGGRNSLWPTPLGLAATFDPAVVRSFGETVSREYRALGIATALSPQADLATDPRWRRNAGTFGEEPRLVTEMVRTYIDAFQTSSGPDVLYAFRDHARQGDWGRMSVNCMVKHWPGGGTGEGGRDAHLSIGKYAVYPGGNLEGQMDPFALGAFDHAGPTRRAAAVMPYYTVSWGQDPSGAQVGNSYSEYIVGTLLRGRFGYRGIVCTDWGITADYNGDPLTTQGKCYGVEDLTVARRHYRALRAGVDQFGGAAHYAGLQGAWDLWAAEEEETAARRRFEKSAARVLEGFFRTGLFENAYTDPQEAVRTVLGDDGRARGFEAQLKSVVMLKNRGGALPVRGRKVWMPLRRVPGVYSMTGRLKKPGYVGYGFDTLAVSRHFTLVEDPAQADFALLALGEPVAGIGYDPEDRARGGNGYLPISLQYTPYTALSARSPSLAGGDPAEDFSDRSYRGKTVTCENASDVELVRQARAQMGTRPVIVLLPSCSRPFVPEFEPWADAVLLGFGVTAEACMQLVCGQAEPSGLLPVQMPADMETVEAQAEDLPRDMRCWQDSEGNRYDFAFGMNWQGVISDARTARWR